MLSRLIGGFRTGGGLSGISSILRRQYSTYRTIMLPPSLIPKNIIEARDLAKRQADILYDRGFWNEYLDSKGNPVFSMATCTEFALNGYQDVIIDPPGSIPETVYKYDLSRLVPRDIYQAYTEQRLSYQKEMHWSVLWSDGSVGIDTGQKLDGKTVVENRGTMFSGISGLSETEAKNNIVTYTKAHFSPIDHPDQEKFTREFSIDSGTGPVNLLVKDFSGGRSISIALAICLDLVHITEYLKGPINPEIIINPSGGSPDKGDGEAEIIVIDTQDLSPDFVRESSGVWKPGKEIAYHHPALKSILDRTRKILGENNISIADAIEGYLNKFVQSPITAFDVLNKYVLEGGSIVRVDGGVCFESDLRPIYELNQPLIDEMNKLSKEGQLTILDGKPEVESGKEGVDPVENQGPEPLDQGEK